MQVLKDARELLSEPHRWTQHAMAKDADGTILGALPGYWSDSVDSVKHPDAVCFCADGALMRVAPDEPSYLAARSQLIEAVERLGYGSNTHVFYNDFTGRTHDQVLNLFDEALNANPS